MKILITGSHFTPAVATIEELRKYPNTEIVYVGRNSTREGDSSVSVESQELPKLGVKFLGIITGRLQRHLDIHTILSLLKIPVGLLQSFYIVVTERPDVVLSFGGYVAVPVVVSAWLMSVPVIIHEQTLMAGLANKISSWFADKIAISFEENVEFPKNKAVLTGNPIRKSVLQPVKLDNNNEYAKIFSNANKRKVPVIFVTGGNQGSHAINIQVEEDLKKLLAVACIIHQTGDSEYQDYERLKALENESYLVKKWVGDEIGTVIKNSDLVISRAGINTLLELAYLQKPAVVIPLPIHNEQSKNANFFANLGLAKVAVQRDLSKDFWPTIRDALKNLPQLKQSAKAAQKIVIKDAAKRLCVETQILVK